MGERWTGILCRHRIRHRWQFDWLAGVSPRRWGICPAIPRHYQRINVASRSARWAKSSNADGTGGVTPALPEQIGGLIEVPDLAASLILNKGDFIRTGARGAAYLAYRKAIQEAVSRPLEAWGDTRAGTT